VILSLATAVPALRFGAGGLQTALPCSSEIVSDLARLHQSAREYLALSAMCPCGPGRLGACRYGWARTASMIALVDKVDLQRTAPPVSHTSAQGTRPWLLISRPVPGQAGPAGAPAVTPPTGHSPASARDG
jgi:hypothetical protein